MTDFRLIVINDLHRISINTKVPYEELPENVILINSPYDDDLPLPEGKAGFLITDIPTHASIYIRRKNWHVVYVGRLADCARIAGRLYDIWSPLDPPELIYKRFLRAVRQLKNVFDVDFYKRALDIAINSVPDMLWFKRSDGVHTLVNDRFCQVVQKPKSEVIGHDHDYIWDYQLPETEYKISEEMAVKNGKTYICDEPVLTSDGVKQFTTYKTPIYDKYGNLFGTVGVGHNVTDFGNMGIELSILTENLPFPMTVFSTEWKVIKMNSMFSGLCGAVTEAQQKDFDYLNWKEENFTPVSDRQENTLDHTAKREYIFETGGEQKSIVVNELEIRDSFDNISGYIVTLTDITYERAYEKSILEAANTDMLTGIYNRRYFYSYLGQIKGKPFTLIYMDLDRFKAINDTLGHASGDKALVRTAELIKEHFPGCVCMRLGGDEFAVIDESSSQVEIQRRCGELELAVKEEFKDLGTDTTISIGINATDGTADDIDEIFRTSDERMYQTKEQHHSK